MCGKHGHTELKERTNSLKGMELIILVLQPLCLLSVSLSFAIVAGFSREGRATKYAGCFVSFPRELQLRRVKMNNKGCIYTGSPI
jgi:hypothetical protein